MRAYVQSFLAVLVSGLGSVAAVNLVIDPFGTLPSPGLPGVNVPKTELENRARLAKAHAIRWIEPTALVLGSSSALMGLDPRHPGWRSERPYNLALPAGSIRDCRRHLEHGLATGKLDQVVLGLDLPMFNVHFQVTGDFAEDRLRVKEGGRRVGGRPFEPLMLLFSIETLAASLRTVRRNQAGAPGIVAWPDGRLDLRREAEWVRRFGGVRGNFAQLEKGFLQTFFFPPPMREFRFEEARSGRSTFGELTRILSIARENGIELHLFFSPTHVRLREIAHAAGLGAHLERWIRTVTELAAENEVPLLDFGGYHRFTTEELPSSGDGTMRWYFDTAHYKKELGDLVLDRVFGRKSESPDRADGFGVRLTPENLEDELERARVARERYRAAHPAEVAEIEEWARRAERVRTAATPPGDGDGAGLRGQGR